MDVVVGSVVVVVVFVAVGRRMGFVGIGSRSRRKGFEGGVVDVGGGVVGVCDPPSRLHLDSRDPHSPGAS